jgi:hypothetical protein
MGRSTFGQCAAIIVCAASCQLVSAAEVDKSLLTMITCKLATHQTVTLSRLIGPGDAHVVFVALNGQAPVPLFGQAKAEASGSNLKARCARTHRASALVLQGEFEGSGYPMGAAWIWNPYRQAVQRVDFAERSFPTRVLVSPSGATLVLPNHSAEQPGHWLSYSQGVNDREALVGGADLVYRQSPQWVINVGLGKRLP